MKKTERMVSIRQSNNSSFNSMPELKEASVAATGKAQGYPFIDKGQLALKRGKPNEQ